MGPMDWPDPKWFVWGFILYSLSMIGIGVAIGWRIWG